MSSEPTPAAGGSGEPATPALNPAVAATVRSGDRAARRWRFDFFLVGLMLVFAFLLASFAIQSSMFWLHLATGRFLADGLGNLGVDPFLFTTQGVLWVNHSWLYDLLLFYVYNLVGGPGLVVLNALTVAATAAVMLRVRPEKGSLWIGVVCVGLALIAMSPRLLFDPLCLSLLFLAVTLVVLLRPTPDAPRRWWLLPPLFLLWVNLDPWFILGPLCIALVLFGAAVHHVFFADPHGDDSPTPADSVAKALRRQRLRTLGLVFLAGLVACLVNPFGYHAFTLPAELAYLLAGLGDFWPGHLVASGTVLRELAIQDPSLTQPFQSPVLEESWQQWWHGPNLVALAYWLLLFGGLASFGAPLLLDKESKQRQSLWPRFLLWLCFAVLSLLMARMIVFFALVGGSIMACNWQELAFQLPLHTKNPLARTWPTLGRFLTAVALLVLLVLCWPGWIQDRFSSGSSTFRVRWDVAPEPGLQQAAIELGRLQEKGALQRCFNFSPGVACYCAWFSPEVKSFYDFRFGLLAGKAGDLGALRRSFKALSAPPNLQSADLQEKRAALFAKYQITHVAFTNVALTPSLMAVVSRLLAMPNHWTLVVADGYTIAFRWSADARTLPAGQPVSGIDFAALAFTGPSRQIDAADEKIVFPQPPDATTKFLFGEKKTSLATNRAAFYLQTYDVLAAYRYTLSLRATKFPWHSLTALAQRGSNLATLPPAVGPLTDALTGVESVYSLLDPMADTGPPGLALLAVQAARQGLLDNPNDPEAYRVLFLAYDKLAGNSKQAEFPGMEEEHWNTSAGIFFPTLRKELRFRQKAAALHALGVLQPDAPLVHYLLMRHALSLHYLDLALEHASKAQQLMARYPSAVDGPMASEQRKEINQQFEQLSQEVPARLNYLEGRAKGLTAVQKAKLAILRPDQLPPELLKRIEPKKMPAGLGLAGVALETLEEQDQDKLAVGFTPEKLASIELRLDMLMNLGRTKEALELLAPLGAGDAAGEKLGRTGLFAWWFVTAATGAYHAFDEKLARVDEGLQHPQFLGKWLPKEWMSGAAQVASPGNLVFFMGLPGEAAGLPHPGQVLISLAGRALELDKLQNRPDFGVGFLAEVRFLRGLIALEAGNPHKAEKLFESALKVVSAPYGFSDQPVAENYLRQIKEAKQRQKK